jgi:hypothetical protein
MEGQNLQEAGDHMDIYHAVEYMFELEGKTIVRFSTTPEIQMQAKNLDDPTDEQLAAFYSQRSYFIKQLGKNIKNDSLSCFFYNENGEGIKISNDFFSNNDEFERIVKSHDYHFPEKVYQHPLVGGLKPGKVKISRMELKKLYAHKVQYTMEEIATTLEKMLGRKLSKKGEYLAFALSQARLPSFLEDMQKKRKKALAAIDPQAFYDGRGFMATKDMDEVYSLYTIFQENCH